MPCEIDAFSSTSSTRKPLSCPLSPQSMLYRPPDRNEKPSTVTLRPSASNASGGQKVMVSELLPLAPVPEIVTEHGQLPVLMLVTLLLAGMSPRDPVTALPMLIPLLEVRPLIVLLLFVIPDNEIGGEKIMVSPPQVVHTTLC